jgi:hypothetical protein
MQLLYAAKKVLLVFLCKRRIKRGAGVFLLSFPTSNVRYRMNKGEANEREKCEL